MPYLSVKKITFMKNLTVRLLRQPLMHFFLIAAVLFAYNHYSEQQKFNEENVIVITEDKLEQIHLKYVKLWRKQPTPQELQALVRDYALDEAYAREARKVGFDANDAVIKRRLKQKLRFMINDVSVMEQPSDESLYEFYQAHIENYKKADIYSFEFIALDSTNGAINISPDLITSSDSSGNYSEQPNPIAVSNWDSYDVDKRFGAKFLEQLATQPLEQWSSPIKATSQYFQVKVTSKTENDYYSFDNAKARVLDDWRIQLNQENLDTYESKLLNDYQVVMSNSDANS